MRVEVEAFSDDAIACKDAIQVGPNYKPGGATFGAGTKTPIGARLVTYLLVLCLGWNVRLIVSLPRRYDVMTLRKHIYRFPQRHNAITWYVKTFRNVNYVC